jgi:hypothetical protein
VSTIHETKDLATTLVPLDELAQYPLIGTICRDIL